MNVLNLVLISVVNFLFLVFSNSLHLRRDRLRHEYRIDSAGTYSVFRETVSNRDFPEKSVVLVVGFELKFIDSIEFFHWIFQKLCIVTTPFWSGFPGFKIKLWMVDTKAYKYLGIYEWQGRQNAQTYADALIKILSPLSTPMSVWHKIITNQSLEEYLRANRKRVP